MIHNVRLPNGHKRPQLPGEIACPWNMHYHSGDEIEVELEMIICKHKTEEFMKEIFGG
jgi:hypothetical protein